MLIEAKNHGDVRTTDRTRTSYTFQVTNTWFAKSLMVTLTLTWPWTFIMLHFATHTHDVPAFSSPAFSTPAIWSRVFQSCLFHSRDLVPRFPVPRFQRPRIMQMMPKSSPHTRVGTLLPVTGDACLIFQRDANIHNTWSKRHSSIMLCDCYQIFKQARLIVYNTATGVTTGKTVWTCTAGLSVLSFTVNNRKKCTTMVYFHCDMTLQLRAFARCYDCWHTVLNL